MDGHTVIFTADGEIHAQQIRSFLAANDIPCVFRGEALRNVHGFTIDGLGKVDIYVADEHAARARALLAEADAGDLALPDDRDVED
jgi:hypothetical protein